MGNSIASSTLENADSGASVGKDVLESSVQKALDKDSLGDRVISTEEIEWIGYRESNSMENEENDP